MLPRLMNLLFGRPKYWIVRLGTKPYLEGWQYEKGLSIMQRRVRPRGRRFLIVDGPFDSCFQAAVQGHSIASFPPPRQTLTSLPEKSSDEKVQSSASN